MNTDGTRSRAGARRLPAARPLAVACFSLCPSGNSCATTGTGVVTAGSSSSSSTRRSRRSGSASERRLFVERVAAGRAYRPVGMVSVVSSVSLA